MEQQPNSQQGLVSLNDAHDFKVAEDNEDIRGWDIRAQDGEKIGEVKDLLVDPEALRTRFLDVELDSKVASDKRHVLIPVGAARLADDSDDVLVNLPRDQIARIPAYDERSGLTRDYESTLRSSVAGAFGGRDREIDDERFYDESGLFGSRRGREPDRDEVRMTRAEEELAIGKRRVQAGAAYLRKHVETEHVSEPVTRMREEVTVERRPVDRSASGNVEIGDQEIRVPVTEEEVVVEKRPVVKEEVVVKKRAVAETDTVEADVRHEEVDVDDRSIRDRATARGKSAGGKIADAADKAKDKIDGNPRT